MRKVRVYSQYRNRFIIVLYFTRARLTRIRVNRFIQFPFAFQPQIILEFCRNPRRTFRRHFELYNLTAVHVDNCSRGSSEKENRY